VKAGKCILKKKNAYAIMPVGKKETMCPCRCDKTKTPERQLRDFLFLFLAMGRLTPIG